MRDQTDRSVHLEHTEIVSLCCDITKGFVQRSAQVLCWQMRWHQPIDILIISHPHPSTALQGCHCGARCLCGRMPDSQSSEPGFESLFVTVSKIGHFRSLHWRPCSLSCINEYLAIDSGGNVSDLALARNCCLARMLPGEAELVSEWTGLPGEAKSVKRFERSNGLDTALWYGMVWYGMVFIYSTSLYIICIAHHYNINKMLKRKCTKYSTYM